MPFTLSEFVCCRACFLSGTVSAIISASPSSCQRRVSLRSSASLVAEILYVMLREAPHSEDVCVCSSSYCRWRRTKTQRLHAPTSTHACALTLGSRHASSLARRHARSLASKHVRRHGKPLRHRPTLSEAQSACPLLLSLACALPNMAGMHVFVLCGPDGLVARRSGSRRVAEADMHV